MPGEEIRTHQEVKKLYDHGFGRAVKGFRTYSDAQAFLEKFRALDTDTLRTLYPAATEDMSEAEIVNQQKLVELRFLGRGVEGLMELFGGSAEALERALCGVGKMALGRFRVDSTVTAATKLGQNMVLDIYVFGTEPTGVPDFDSFLAHRTAKAFAYKLGERMARGHGVDDD